MSNSVFEQWLVKRKLLYQLRNKAQSNSIRVYFLKKSGEVVFVKTYKRYDEAYIVKVSSLDYATLRRYIADGSFIIFKGKSTTSLVDFLLKSKGRKWLHIERQILDWGNNKRPLFTATTDVELAKLRN